MSKKEFRIQNPQGLYSDGGNPPSFSKNGKVWHSLTRLREHLKFRSAVFRYGNCKIVETNNRNKNISLNVLVEHALLDDECIGTLLHGFVTYGRCYTSELYDIITGERDLYKEEVDKYVPVAIIDSIDEFMNVGITDCTPTALGEVILSCTKEQLQLYYLNQ